MRFIDDQFISLSIVQPTMSAPLAHLLDYETWYKSNET